MSYLKAASLWSVGEIKGNLEKSYSFVEKNFSFSDWFSRWDTWRTIKIYFLRFLVNFYAKKKLSFLKLSLPWDDDDTLHHAFTYPGLLPTWRDLDLLFFQRAFSLVFFPWNVQSWSRESPTLSRRNENWSSCLIFEIFILPQHPDDTIDVVVVHTGLGTCPSKHPKHGCMEIKTLNFYDPDRYFGQSQIVWWDSVVWNEWKLQSHQAQCWRWPGLSLSVYTRQVITCPDEPSTSVPPNSCLVMPG